METEEIIDRAYSFSVEVVRSVFAVPLEAQSVKSEMNDWDETITMLWLRLQIVVETIIEENFAERIFMDCIQKFLQELRKRIDEKSLENSRGLRSDLYGLTELLKNSYRGIREEKEDKEEKLRKEKEDKEEKLRKDKEERRFNSILVAVVLCIVAVSIAIKF